MNKLWHELMSGLKQINSCNNVQIIKKKLYERTMEMKSHSGVFDTQGDNSLMIIGACLEHFLHL